MFLAQIAKVGVRKCCCKPAKLNCQIVKILGGELRPLSICGASARFVDLNIFLNGGSNVFSFNCGDRPQVSLDHFG